MDWIESCLESACPFIRRVKKFYSNGLPVYQIESDFWNTDVQKLFDVYMFSYHVEYFTDELGLKYVRLCFHNDY